MSPCCLAAAAATALLTALIAVGLTGFVLVTDGFGLGVLSCTLLAAAFQRWGLVGPCPSLLNALSTLLAARAALLLATKRRPLVVTLFGRVRADAALFVRRLVRILKARSFRRGRAGRIALTRSNDPCCH
ncbi:MAG: hypothetical protein U0835_23485 [Isosphaeraceae bacterium]